MDEAKKEQPTRQGHSPLNPNWIPRPKLEIPNIEPTTPRRQGTSAQSPQGIYDFPISPQSPREGMISSPLVKPTCMKTIPTSLWISQDNYIDLVPNCLYYSPRSNHPGHGFGDCNAECDINNNNSSNSSNTNNKNSDSRSHLSLSLNLGDNVLVRCNQSKWLPGQVKRVSNNSVKVWIGVAEILVDVPIELFPSHLARMECATTCTSPNEFFATQLHHTQQQIRTQVHCVRPAHLSHRRLFQVISPNNPMANCAQQVYQVQCPNSTFTNSKTKCERNPQCFTPPNASNLPNLFEHIAYLEKMGIIPPKYDTFQQPPRTFLEPLHSAREGFNLQENGFDDYKGFANLQAQYNWRLHMAELNQHGNRSNYPRPPTSPTLNANFNNEGMPSSNSPFPLGKNPKNFQHIQTPPHINPQQLYYINQEPPMYAFYDDSRASTLYKPHYEQFVTPHMVSKSTMTNPDDVKSPKRPPTPPPQLSSPKRPPTPPPQLSSPKRPPTPPLQLSSPKRPPTPPLQLSAQLLTKGMMDLRENKSPKRPPIPSYFKGKDACEDQACPSWTKGTDFHQVLGSNQGMSLERSVSLDSFKPPAFFDMVDPPSPEASQPKNATSSVAPVWVTVIDNRNNTRKL